MKEEIEGGGAQEEHVMRGPPTRTVQPLRLSSAITALDPVASEATGRAGMALGRGSRSTRQLPSPHTMAMTPKGSEANDPAPVPAPAAAAALAREV